jgi:hypothetical protein
VGTTGIQQKEEEDITGPCMVDMSIRAPKIGALQINPKKNIMAIFLRRGTTILLTYLRS